MKQQEKVRLAMDLVKRIIGDDKQAMVSMAWQMLEMATGMRRRMTAGRKPQKREAHGG